MHCTDDPIYSAVKGGCSLANVTKFGDVFNSFVFASDRSSFPAAPTEGLFCSNRSARLGEERYFYTQYLNWFKFLNAGRRNYKVHGH